MELGTFGVRASAGTLRETDGVTLPHTWTPEGVVAGPVSNGAQVLHLSIAMCVLNDTFREAARLGIPVTGVMVEADGAFDDDWRSTGISYSVRLDSPAPPGDQASLLVAVDEVAEIPRALRSGTAVVRAD